MNIFQRTSILQKVNKLFEFWLWICSLTLSPQDSRAPCPLWLILRLSVSAVWRCSRWVSDICRSNCEFSISLNCLSCWWTLRSEMPLVCLRSTSMTHWLVGQQDQVTLIWPSKLLVRLQKASHSPGRRLSRNRTRKSIISLTFLLKAILLQNPIPELRNRISCLQKKPLNASNKSGRYQMLIFHDPCQMGRGILTNP